MRYVLQSVLLVLCAHTVCVAKQTSDDSLTIARKAEMQALSHKWIKVKPKDDSAFVSDNGMRGAAQQYLREGTFPAGTETDFKKSAKGDVIGPYSEMNTICIYKIADRIRSADSVQVSHILYCYAGSRGASPDQARTKQQAKKSADSLCALIQKGTVLLENVVEQVTDDPGSRAGNKGNYGWFTRESGFIQVYKDAAFNNPVGATVVIESEFGFHIVQVETKTEELNFYVVWKIEQLINRCFSEFGYPVIIQEAEFPGGEEGVRNYFNAEKVKYDSLNQPRFRGLVVMFSVNILEDGSPVNLVLFFNPLMGTIAEDQFRSIILAMPKAAPARTCDGPVPSSQILVITL